MGHVDMGLSQISHLQLRISTLILNEKSQHFKVQEGQHTPQEKVSSFPCLAFADNGGSDVDVGMGNHQAECFHLSLTRMSWVTFWGVLSHWLTRRLGFALLLLDESEFPTTKNLQLVTTTTTTGFPTPIYWIIPNYCCFWEGNLLVPFKKTALRIMGFSAAQFYIYIHHYIIIFYPLKKKLQM